MPDTNYLYFKKGGLYSRKAIWNICQPPDKPYKQGGNWATAFSQVGNNLIIFMNIGVPGTTGHDFDNHFDAASNTIIWYGKPDSHSKQPIFAKLLSGEITPHFFARWDTNNLQFTYLGTGTIVSFEDGVKTNFGTTIRTTVICHEARDILEYSVKTALGSKLVPPSPTYDLPQIRAENRVADHGPTSSFLLEKHLEDYIEHNWEHTAFGEKYSLYENGRQYQTDTGPLDLLAQSKDRKQFLVLELKRDKPSDATVGQTLRYMGYIKKTFGKNNADIRGAIIASQEDLKLQRALEMVPNVDFYRYSINFSLDKVNV